MKRARTHGGVWALVLAAGVTGRFSSAPAQTPPFDVLFRGQVSDGTGAAAQRVAAGIPGDVGDGASRPPHIDATRGGRLHRLHTIRWS